MSLGLVIGVLLGAINMFDNALSQPPGLPPKPKAIPGSPEDNNKVKISLQKKIGQRIDRKMLGKYELCPENILIFIPEPQEAPQKTTVSYCYQH